MYVSTWQSTMLPTTQHTGPISGTWQSTSPPNNAQHRAYRQGSKCFFKEKCFCCLFLHRPRPTNQGLEPAGGATIIGTRKARSRLPYALGPSPHQSRGVALALRVGSKDTGRVLTIASWCCISPQQQQRWWAGNDGGIHPSIHPSRM